MSLDYNYVNNLAFRDSDINEYLLALYGVAVGMKAKVIVELGGGQSSYALTAAANETKGQFYSIDSGKKEVTIRLFPAGEGVLEKESRKCHLKMDYKKREEKWQNA